MLVGFFHFLWLTNFHRILWSFRKLKIENLIDFQVRLICDVTEPYLSAN